MFTLTLIVSAAAQTNAYSSHVARRQLVRPYGDGSSIETWVYDFESSDNFDGAKLDSKWIQTMDGWVGTAPGFFQDGNAALDANGALHLHTKYEAGKAPDNIENCDCGFGNVTVPLLTSTKMMQYGYFETKAKFANAEVLSSFWVSAFAASFSCGILFFVSAILGAKRLISLPSSALVAIPTRRCFFLSFAPFFLPQIASR